MHKSFPEPFESFTHCKKNLPCNRFLLLSTLYEKNGRETENINILADYLSLCNSLIYFIIYSQDCLIYEQWKFLFILSSAQQCHLLGRQCRILHNSGPVLKVLSIEMHLTESGLIRKAFIKERGAEILRKFCPAPTVWETFDVFQCRTNRMKQRI